MVESLIHYRNFTKSLTDFGFKINQYNPCIANNMIHGKQMTLCYHVENCKLIHHRSNVNDRIIKWFRQEYEIIFEDRLGKMMVSRGNVY